MHFSVIQIFKVNDIRIHRDRLLHFSIFMIIVTFIVGIALFYSDIVIDSVPLLKRLFSEKLRISSDGRWIRMYTVLSNINSYPLGDMPFTYAHNFFS